MSYVSSKLIYDEESKDLKDKGSLFVSGDYISQVKSNPIFAATR